MAETRALSFFEMSPIPREILTEFRLPETKEWSVESRGSKTNSSFPSRCTCTDPVEWRIPRVACRTMDTKRLSEWWATLNDPELTSLVNRAIQKNIDLRKATALVREARARSGISEAALFPSVDVSGSVQHTRSSAQPMSNPQVEQYRNR